MLICKVRALSAHAAAAGQGPDQAHYEPQQRQQHLSWAQGGFTAQVRVRFYGQLKVRARPEVLLGKAPTRPTTSRSVTCASWAGHAMIH